MQLRPYRHPQSDEEDVEAVGAAAADAAAADAAAVGAAAVGAAVVDAVAPGEEVVDAADAVDLPVADGVALAPAGVGGESGVAGTDDVWDAENNKAEEVALDQAFLRNSHH